MKIYIVYNDDMDYGSSMENTIESVWSTEEKAKARIKYLIESIQEITVLGHTYRPNYKFWNIYEEEVNNEKRN